MKDDRWQHLNWKPIHILQRLPRVPTPHISSVEILNGRKSDGGRRASRSLRNLSNHGASKKNVDLSGEIG